MTPAREAPLARVAAARVRADRDDRVRARDGLQRNVRVGRARARQPGRLPRAAEHLRARRHRADDRRLAHRLPQAAPARAAAHHLGARPLRGRARDRRAHQRREALDRLRPCGVPAVRAREARARHLVRGVPRAQAAAADAQGSRPAGRHARRTLLPPHPRRARPRHRDHDRDDGRRHAAHRRHAVADARSRVRHRLHARVASPRTCRRTAAPACSSSSIRGRTRRATASRTCRR